MKSSIKFVLDRPNSDKPTYIFLKYQCKDGLLKYSTRQSTLPSNWNPSLQQTNDRAINVILDKLYTIVERYVETCRIMGNAPVYRLDLIKELNEGDSRQERAKTSHFFGTVDFLIEQMKAGKILTPKKTKYTEGTIKGLTRSRNRFLEFNKSLEFGTITIQTYHNFINWCNDKGYTLNYTSALVKDWKTLMTIAFDKGYHKNLVHKSKEFKKTTEDSFQIYLNEEEIQKLQKIDLSHSAYLTNIRDRFIVNLYSGLRISDMKTLTIKNFNFVTNTITHINKKTSKRVVMPIHPKIKEIITQYNGDLPRQYSDQVVNREIKVITKPFFTELITYTKTVGGQRQQFTKEKWEMISSHTCRRSMVTNILKTADVQSVMPVMGMSLKTIQGYNKRSMEENAAMLQTNSFFSK